MSKFIDLTGQRFGFWIATERVANTTKGVVQWRCICECGKEKYNYQFITLWQ